MSARSTFSQRNDAVPTAHVSTSTNISEYPSCGWNPFELNESSRSFENVRLDDLLLLEGKAIEFI